MFRPRALLGRRSVGAAAHRSKDTGTRTPRRLPGCRPPLQPALPVPRHPLRCPLPTFLAALAESERESIRESALEGLDAVAPKGRHGGRQHVVTEDMRHTTPRRRVNGESVEQSQPDLIIPTGKSKGQAPSVASVSARSPSTRRQEGSGGLVQAHAGFADPQVRRRNPSPPTGSHPTGQAARPQLKTPVSASDSGPDADRAVRGPVRHLGPLVLLMSGCHPATGAKLTRRSRSTGATSPPCTAPGMP